MRNVNCRCAMNSDSAPLNLPEANEGNFEAEVLRSRQPTLVAFGASWSKPCQILKSVLGQVAAECAGKIRLVAVNVDNNPDLGLWYGIESVPTLVCFVEGKARARIVGTASAEAILSRLEPFCAGAGKPASDQQPQ